MGNVIFGILSPMKMRGMGEDDEVIGMTKDEMTN